MAATTTEARDQPVVAITGATGLIGTALAAHLRGEGFRVRRIVRSRSGTAPGDITWAPDAGVIDARELEGTHAIVNLAGAPIGERWTGARKREIRESRLLVTTTIARAIASLERKPAVVLSGSAVGYYGDRGDEILDETSGAGSDFLATVVRDWEAAAQPIADSGVRVALLRSGLVLSRRGGALAKMLTPFQLGVGGPMGTGRQWMSWISLHDHVRAARHIIATESISGAVNMTGPAPTRNDDFVHTLGRALHRPAFMPLPAIALEFVFGEMARATLLVGQRVMPRVLQASGFSFDDPTLERALGRALDEAT